jgi:hypothetical protein
MHTSSEQYPGLPPERLDLLKRCLPSHDLPARPVDLFETNQPRIWLVSNDRLSVIGLFNWGDREPAGIAYDMKKLGLDAGKRYVAFDFWADGFAAPFEGELKQTLPPGTCRVLAVREEADRPQLLSTSRHITQGLIDVLEEEWDAATRTLSGRSLVVGGDAYEMRIAAFAPGAVWRVSSARVSPEDSANGVTIDSRGGNGMVRATVKSPASRTVAWSLVFEKAPVSAAGPARPEGLEAEAPRFGPVRLSWRGADGVSHEVTRDGERLGTASGAGWTDPGVAPGKAYVYTVTAIGFSGERSAPASIEVRTPDVPKLGPRPPKPDVKLSSLKALESRTGWGRVGIGKSAGGKGLRIGEERFDDGIGVHAESLLVYERAPEFRRFVAVAGIDAEIDGDERASVVMKVISEARDGRRTEIDSSPVLKLGESDRWHFDVALPGDCARVRLVVDDAGDGVACDHADWADAGFVTD